MIIGRPHQYDWGLLLESKEGEFLNYGKGSRNSKVTACRAWLARRGYKVIVKSILTPKGDVCIAYFNK